MSVAEFHIPYTTETSPESPISKNRLTTAAKARLAALAVVTIAALKVMSPAEATPAPIPVEISIDVVTPENDSNDGYVNLVPQAQFELGKGAISLSLVNQLQAHDPETGMGGDQFDLLMHDAQRIEQEYRKEEAGVVQPYTRVTMYEQRGVGNYADGNKRFFLNQNPDKEIIIE